MQAVNLRTKTLSSLEFRLVWRITPKCCGPDPGGVQIGSSGMWCFRMWGLEIMVDWPSTTEGVGTSHQQLIWVRGFAHSVWWNPISWNTTFLNTQAFRNLAPRKWEARQTTRWQSKAARSIRESRIKNSEFGSGALRAKGRNRHHQTIRGARVLVDLQTSCSENRPEDILTFTGN